MHVQLIKVDQIKIVHSRSETLHLFMISMFNKTD